MSFLFNAGSFAGKSVATAVHGTKLGATQFALGYASGYEAKRAALIAQRDALTTPVAEQPVAAPVVTKQRRATVKA